MNSPAGDHAAPAACDNCATALHGHYCHACGQHAHNPLRSFGHAIEEVFESFWHLDGRIVRTLHDLLFPGRLAARFLRGHRAPYVPPLRLFVVLSVLTFFVAQFAIHVEKDLALPKANTFDLSSKQVVPNAAAFASDTSVAAVRAHLDARLAQIGNERADVPDVAFVQQAIDLGVRQTRADAQARMHQIDPSQPATLEPAPGANAAADDDAEGGTVLSAFGLDPSTHPVQIDALPGFVNRWINKKLARAQINLQRYSEDPGEGIHTLIAAIPTALFLLVPVFALLLKVAYLGSGRGYLEHLVVGLYSHAFMVLTLLAMFVMMLIDQALPAGAAWLSWLLAALRVLLLLWLPVYLWWTQWRAYGEPWWLTTIKYLVIGNLYFVLLFVVALLTMISSVFH
ncbi:MAG: DUF3667 domain-containing protein [Pseudoxanthomonas sp.]|jgi:hypothetical protein